MSAKCQQETSRASRIVLTNRGSMHMPSAGASAMMTGKSQWSLEHDCHNHHGLCDHRIDVLDVSDCRKPRTLNEGVVVACRGIRSLFGFGGLGASRPAGTGPWRCLPALSPATGLV